MINNFPKIKINKPKYVRTIKKSHTKKKKKFKFFWIFWHRNNFEITRIKMNLLSVKDRVHNVDYFRYLVYLSKRNI